MIEINLLPEERKKRFSRSPFAALANISFEGIPFLTIIYIAVGAIIIIQTLLFLGGMYTKRGFYTANKKLEDTLVKKRAVDALKASSRALERKVKTINELMIDRLSWSRKLNTLSDSMEPGVWLSELYLDEKISDRPVAAQPGAKAKEGVDASRQAATEKIRLQYLIISGFALNAMGEGTASVGRFIKRLKENAPFYSDFSDIELGSIKQEKSNNIEVMSFKITCLFKKVKKVE